MIANGNSFGAERESTERECQLWRWLQRVIERPA
jgi:hypothetical protein